MTTKQLARAGGGFVLLAAGIGLGFWLSGSFGGEGKEALPPLAAAASRPGTAVSVTAAAVTTRTLQRTVEAVGTVYGYEDVMLSAKVEGRVLRVRHDVSDRVPPGEVLLELDPTDYDLAVRQAEKALQVELAKLGVDAPPGPKFDLDAIPVIKQAVARYENAKAQVARAERIGGALSSEEKQQRQTDLKVALAEYQNQRLIARAGLATVEVKQEALAIARQQLADTKIVVPTPTMAVPGGGMEVQYAVTARTVSEGTFVRAGTEVMRLVIDRTLKLKTPVPERFAGEVKVGQTVEVTTAASSKPVTGTVTRINPSVDPASRTFEVEVQVPNPKAEVKPGSFAKAAIRTRSDEGSITVPLIAPTSYAGVTKLFLVESGRAREYRVTLGMQGVDWVEIVSPPLPPGATVVTSGQAALADGTPLVIRATKEGDR